MIHSSWNRFEWDDENKKNGNVQHLRDHGIEPTEAEECFFHEFEFARDERRFDDVYVLDGKTSLGRRLRLVLPGQRKRLGQNNHRLGVISKEDKEKMKKQFAKLSKAEQEKIEQEYQRMKPADFEQVMSRAKKHVPAASARQKRKNTVERKRAA